MNPSSPTYYDLLDISPAADLSEIRRAFRQLARQYHPDVNPGDRIALEQFQRLSHAYHVLSDPHTRAHYDATLKGVALPQSERSHSRTATEWYQQGLQFFQQTHYQNAIESYDQAIRLNPQFLEAYNQRGFSYHKLGKTVEAFADYGEALALNAQQATSYYYRGLTRLQLGYSQGAIADFSQAIDIDPDHGQAYYQRGMSYLELNEHHQARRDFMQAEQIFLKQNKAFLAHDAHLAHQQLGKGRVMLALRRSIQVLPSDLAIVLFLVVTQPKSSFVACCDRLPPQRSLIVTCVLLIGFVLSLIHTVNSRWSSFHLLGVIGISAMTTPPSILTLIGIGLMPFIVFMIGIILTQFLARQQINWQTSCFLAAIALLPLYGIFLVMEWVSMPMFYIIELICGGYSLLLLYGGYRYGLQCNHAIALTSAISLIGILTIPIVFLLT